MKSEHMTAIFNLDITKKYIFELFNFVETFLLQEEIIQEALAADDSEKYFKILIDICIGLKKIHAAELAAEWMKYVNTMKKDDIEATKFLVSDFLVHVSMLTLDIQTAIFHQEHKSGAMAKLDATDEQTLNIPMDKKLIMVVDDLQILLNTVKTYLKNTDYELICMSSQDEALAYLENHRPALFILDIEMPKMDGFTLAKKIRETGHTSPIIYMTGNSSEQNLLNAIEAGAAGFLVKPIPQAQLLKTVQKYVK